MSKTYDAQLDYYGQRLAVASDNVIRIFELTGEAPNQQMNLQTELKDHTGPVWGVAWANPKFGLLASCSYDGKVSIWSETRGQWSKVFTAPHDSSVNAVSWAPQEFGPLLAAGCSDGTVTILTQQRAARGATTFTSQSFVAHLGGVNSVNWAEDVKHPRLATGGCDNYVRTWTSVQGQWVQPAASGVRTCHRGWVRDAKWQPSVGVDSHTIASCANKSVIIWTEGHGKAWTKSASLDMKENVSRVSWSLGGDVLAVAQTDGQSSLWKQGGNGQWNAIVDEKQA